MLPKLLAHFGAGHVSLLYAVSWTPWLLWCSAPRPVGFVRPGVLLAIVFLADPRWAAYAGATWLAYEFAHSQYITKDRKISLRVGLRRTTGEALLSLALSAPLLLPLLEFASYSTRAEMTPADVLVFSLPPVRVFGLLFPSFGSVAEWTVYQGGMVLALAAVGILWGFADPAKGRAFSFRFWGGLALAALLFSFGQEIPFLRLWARLPGANLLRVPPRAMFLFGMSLVALAAFGLDRLQQIPLALHHPQARPGSARARRGSNLLLAGIGLFWLAFPVLLLVISGSLPLSFVFGSAAGLASLAALVLFKRRSALLWPRILVFLVLIADLAAVNLRTLSPRPVDIVFAQAKAPARWLSSQPGTFRVYSPSYSLPQHTAAAYGLELADGVDPLQIRSYAESMSAASGVPATGYSVTIPAFGSPDISSANATYTPDARLLGEWNVGFLVSAFDISAQGLALETTLDGVRIYRNLEVQPRAVDLASGEPVTFSWSPNDIEFDVAGKEGPVAFRLPDYPYWLVQADGKVQPSDGFLSGLGRIPFPPGTQVLRVQFIPYSLYLGLAVFLLASVWLVVKDRGSR
jgi:hypothetical protein